MHGPHSTAFSGPGQPSPPARGSGAPCQVETGKGAGDDRGRAAVGPWQVGEELGPKPWSISCDLREQRFRNSQGRMLPSRGPVRGGRARVGGRSLSPFRSERRKPAVSLLMAPDGPLAFPGPKRPLTGQAAGRPRTGSGTGAPTSQRAGGGASKTDTGSWWLLPVIFGWVGDGKG